MFGNRGNKTPPQAEEGARAKTRGGQRSLLVRFAGIFAVTVLLWAFLEFSSWAVIRAYVTATSDQRSLAEQSVLVEHIGSPLAHPLWAGFDASEDQFRVADLYDPFLSHRLAPSTQIDKWRGTDRYGFIHNGDPNRTIDLGPGTVRVLLLGGSSMAGTGSRSNEETIGGHLERRLNARADGRRYQVINAGVGGFYSSLEAVYFATELVHYKPTVVVMFDGFNDFWHSWAETRDSADRDGVAIPNRSAKQQEYVALFSGVSRGSTIIESLRNPSPFTRVFHYSGDLLASVLSKFMDKAPPVGVSTPVPAAADPWPENAAWLSARAYGSTSHVPYMLANWQNVAAMGVSRDMGVAILLQPFVPVSGRKLTSEEVEAFDQFMARRTHLEPADYERRANEFYREARQGLSALKIENADQQLIHIEDISTILNGEREQMFLDNVHYTHRANAIIAAHIAGIVLKLIDNGAGRDPQSFALQ